ncbi:hypothetical protein BY996DRAFT_6477925 [Phakopsora pachyrhizi]|nr:hypothetical protein BY996DRAFT_6477925 [Phakopsora pachyrhizi]
MLRWLNSRSDPGADRPGRGLAGSWAGQAGAWLGLAGLGPGAGDEIRTKLRPVLKPERQAEGFWVKASEVENLQDVDHVAVVEKASFESGCDFDTKVVQGVMWR